MKSPLLFATALLLAGLAHADEPAPNADKRALNLAVQRDGQHNQSAVAAVSLPVGDSAWLQAGVGLDAARRSGRTRGTLAGTPVEQRVSGHGVGVHGAVALTPRLSVYGATMRNRYTTSTTQTAQGGGLLAGVPLLQNRVSAVNRDEAALDRSHQLGATWRASDRLALNGELQQDRLHDGGSLSSVQLKAAIQAGAGWTLTPGIGHGRGPQGASSNYGLLGASYAW